MAKRKMSENSLKNLLENGKATQFKSGSKAAIENGRKGGLALGKNNKEKRLLKEICEIVGELADEDTGDSNKVAIVKAMYQKAKNGDVNAFNTLRDTMGEKPKERIDTTIKSYSLFEEETENKAEKLESEQQSKKTDKK